MVIQHNIMAMNAYRNYSNNSSALAGNLEKLSSGYKINRAGDDAAGLAISEKMRAQISGLDAAAKNVKDGISLVKTAEGAMQEVQDMLNRMVTLATQSANGTYQDDVDREALQAEIDQLNAEIDRIADSANFNGIKLLDGSLDADGVATTYKGSDRMISDIWDGSGDPSSVTGKKTILDSGAATSDVKTVFSMDFSDLKAVAGASAATKASGTLTMTYTGGTPTWQDGDTVQIAASGGDVTFDVTATYNDTTGEWAVAASSGSGAMPTDFDATFDGDKLTLTAKQAGALTNVGLGTVTVTTTANSGTVATTAAGTITDGTDASAAGGAITTTVTLNNVKIAEDVSINADGDAAAIAQAVMNEIAQSGTDTDSATGVNLFGDGTNYDVKLDGSKITFTLADDPSTTNINGNFDWNVSITGGKYEGNHAAGTTVETPGSVASASARANTVFGITTADLKDGTKITIDGTSVTLSVGDNSTVKAGDGVVTLTDAEAADLNTALSKISEGFGKTGTTNFEVTVNNGGNSDTKTGLAVYRKATSQNTYKTEEELSAVFSMEVAGSGKGKALTLQIGDTSDDYNQLKVSIGDIHADALGVGSINIGNQAGAAEAIDVIKNAINRVSSIRGTLGATQNRLEHTSNNLSVMAENIQDAESTIRDTDVAEEMMSYVKNNILVQSAQAMLAQANQVPQGVLQLLG